MAIQTGELEFGLNSFGDIATDGGRVMSDAETLRMLVEEAQVAESVGLDVFSIGEHYREDMIDSATPVILAAAAQATSAIRLGTSVTVLSTQDPVRLYHQFATVDGLSGGRRSWCSAARRRSSRSRCSGTTLPSTSRSSRRSSTCSCG